MTRHYAEVSVIEIWCTAVDEQKELHNSAFILGYFVSTPQR